VRSSITRHASLLLQYPATISVAIFAIGAVALRLQTVNEPAFRAPWIGIAFWIALVAAMALAERLLGTFVALLIGSVSSAAALLATWGVLTAASRLGESFSAEALQHPLWASSIATVALLGAASSRMNPHARITLRWFILGGAAALLLANGHASDVSRLLAAAFGILGGSIGLGGATEWTWGSSSRSRLRRAISAILILVGVSVITTLVAPYGAGVSTSVVFTLDPHLTAAVGFALIVSALLVLNGRRRTLVVALVVLLMVAAVLVATAIQVVGDDDGFSWADLSSDEIEWSVTVFAVALLPAVAAIVLAATARTLLRRKAPTPTMAERERLRIAARETGGGSLAHMTSWKGNSVWFADDGAAVAYRVSQGIAFTVSDPICRPENIAAAVRGFAAYCDQQGWVPVFYSVHDEVADLSAEIGWARIPVGVEAVLPLAAFTLSGRRRQDLRTAMNRAEREGIEALWSRYADLPREQREQVSAICTSWRSSKALPEMTFTLGGLDELADSDTMLMVAVDRSGRVHGITSWLPDSRDGEPHGWTLDVMRRADRAMPGVMEFLIVSTARRAAADGRREISLSGTPLAPHDGRRTLVSRASARLERLLEPAYGFQTLRRFKEKFAPETRRLWMLYPQHALLPRIGPALAHTYAPTLRFRHVIRLRALPTCAAENAPLGRRVSGQN
jgi:lysylphosphatidylglycerol synthetase-like protein (DUF2156 family)